MMTGSFVRGTWPFLLGAALLAGCASAPGAHRATRADKITAERARQAEADEENRIEATAHYATGLSYDLNDKPDLALQEMLRAAQSEPDYEPVVIEAARRCIRAQKPEQAIALLNKAISAPDASGALYAWLGLAYAQAGKTDLAVSANRTAIKRMPQSLAAYQNLAQIYLQTSRTNEALKVLDEAARQPTDDPGFLIELADLYQRYNRVQSSQTQLITQRVRELLDRATDLGPTNPAHLLRLADAYFGLGELKKAEPFYRDLLEERPDLSPLRSKLIEIYLRNGQKDKAAEQLEALAENDPTNAQTYVFLGAIALEDKKYTEAAEHFERAIKLDPDLEQVYYDLAGLKLMLKKPEDTLAILEKARSRFKLSFPMEFYSGLAYGALKKYSDALTFLTSAEAVAKATDPSRLNQLFYFQMGSTQERAGNIPEAEKYFRQSLKLGPEDPETLNYLGYMWAEHGINLDEARTMIEKAVALQPDNAAFLDSLAWVLFKLNKPKEALVPMLKAVEHTDEPDATLYDHLGDIYSALRQYDDARDAWSKSLKVEANVEIQKKIRSTPAAATPQ
jgi:tetratricopeptide (TPR) repeat protein